MMMNCFCGMVDRQKVFSLISSRDHCQWSSPSRISDTPRVGFEPAQSLSSGLVEWSCSVVITTTPRRHDDELHLKLFFVGRLGPKNWSSLYWLKSGTDIHCLFHVSNLMLFLKFFHSYFFAQIWSHNLKFSKLTESWHRGTLLYAYHSFNISCSKVFVIHSSLGEFDPNLIQKSLIVNRFCVSQHSNCYVQVHKDNFIIQKLRESDLHFFETRKYIKLLKQINIIYISN